MVICSLVTKPFLIETASIYAGTSEEIRLRGQTYHPRLAAVATNTLDEVHRQGERRTYYVVTVG